MLIMAQDRNSIINTDTIAYFQIDRIASIRAVFATPGLASFCMGTYKSPEDCQKVLRDLFRIYEDESAYAYAMPQKEEVSAI